MVFIENLFTVENSADLFVEFGKQTLPTARLIKILFSN